MASDTTLRRIVVVTQVTRPQGYNARMIEGGVIGG
jgi:hypothetical protein